LPPRWCVILGGVLQTHSTSQSCFKNRRAAVQPTKISKMAVRSVCLALAAALLLVACIGGFCKRKLLEILVAHHAAMCNLTSTQM
jgi:hypothetical protein